MLKTVRAFLFFLIVPTMALFNTHEVVAMNQTNNCHDLLKTNLKDISGKETDLCAYENQVILVVNTASECGYTPQYKNLEATYQKYKSRGFVILGFPSNDFGGQEPGTDADVKTFCERNYGVTFPLFAKTSVKKGENPLFKKLIEATGQAPRWNFSKYLIDKKGQVKAFSSGTIGSSLDQEIEAALLR